MLVSLLLAVAIQLPVLRPEVRVDTGAPGTPGAQSLAVEGETALLAWRADQPGGGAQVWAAVSGDHGQAWSAPLRVDADPGSSGKRLAAQSAAVAGDSLFVAWLDRRNGGADAYLRVRPAAGAPRAEVRLDDGFAPGAEDVQQLAMHVSDDGQVVVIVLAMTDGTPLADRLVALRSTDGGASFAAPVLLALSPTGFPFAFHVVGLQLAADGPDVHVVWQDQNFGTALWHQGSDDGGASWGPATQLANGQLSENGQFDVAVVGDRVAIAYAEVSALCGVSTVQSDDGGSTWTPPLRVGNSLSPACVDRSPSVFLAPQHVVVAWADDRLGASRPYIAWSDDLGVSWTEKLLFGAYGTHVRLEGNPENGVFGAFWNGQAQAYVTWSRRATPAPGTVFTRTAVGSGTTLDDVLLAYDPLYSDFLCSWRLDPGSGGALLAGGFRNAQLEALGSFTPGSQLAFVGSGFPESETGSRLQVFASLAPGAVTLPLDGRSIGLAPGTLLSSTLGNPAFQAQIAAAGVGATGVQLLPPTLPTGTPLYFSAISHTIGPVLFGSITDVITRVLQ
jgi:hypothetical protein